jgi:hypothetical protein
MQVAGGRGGKANARFHGFNLTTDPSAVAILRRGG